MQQRGQRELEVLGAVPAGLFVAGEFRPAAGGRTLPVEDPATGEEIARVADADGEDARSALAAAADAAPAWAAVPPRQRGELLRAAYELITERTEDLALLMTLEMGKPLRESRSEIAYAAEFFRWFAEEAVRISGRYTTAPAGGSRLLTTRQPVGPCLLVTPWNFPLAMGTRKLGPALAAGCTAVVKPATATPLSMYALAGILAEVGVPAGVVNVITSSRTSTVIPPLLTDPRLRKLSFTGSTEVGRRLVADAAPNLLRVSMELGGNAPFVVLSDADLDAAVEGAMAAKMRNMGEACTAANRFVVHESLAADFTAALGERIGALRVGPGTDESVDVGPLVDAASRERIAGLVEDAVAGGAKVVTGGAPVGDRGHFYAPTVLSDVAPGSRVLTEEIFGPVAPVVTVADDAEALRVANDTEYGLIGYVYTRDVTRALRFAEGLQTGMVGLNQGVVSNPAAPFGGVKQSGLGREGGPEGIDEYLDTKYVGLPL